MRNRDLKIIITDLSLRDKIIIGQVLDITVTHTTKKTPKCDNLAVWMFLSWKKCFPAALTLLISPYTLQHLKIQTLSSYQSLGYGRDLSHEIAPGITKQIQSRFQSTVEMVFTGHCHAKGQAYWAHPSSLPLYFPISSFRAAVSDPVYFGKWAENPPTRTVSSFQSCQPANLGCQRFKFRSVGQMRSIFQHQTIAYISSAAWRLHQPPCEPHAALCYLQTSLLKEALLPDTNGSSEFTGQEVSNLT